MRIYGGKDYYDSILGYGQDPKTVLVRGDLSFPVKDVPIKIQVLEVTFSSRGWIGDQQGYWTGIVFCDKLYRGVHVNVHGKDHFFWDVNKLKVWAHENDVKIYTRRQYWKRAHLTLDNCMTVLPLDNTMQDFMIENKLAILVDTNPEGDTDRKIWANPSDLKKYGFAKAVDPYTAFQELSMWVSGVLGGQSPKTIRITDDLVIRDSHGFDKHSFRSSTSS